MLGKGKKNNSGLRVAHDFDDFAEERDIVLTLKDSYILDNQEINEGGDVLENVDLAEQFKAQALHQNRTKKDDFMENKYGGGEKKLLPQYDEISTEKEGIMLDSSGEYNLEKMRKIEAIKNKLSSSKKGEVSLETSKNVASEYYTSDEMKKFKKPVKKAVNVQKNREDILKMLEDSMEDTDGHHGNRNLRRMQERDAMEEMTTKKLKTENYEIALEKAREQTRYSAMIDEEYEGIQKAIEKQRKTVQTRKVEDVVKSLMETNQTNTDSSDQTKQSVVILDTFQKKPAEGEKIELENINISTDFLKGSRPDDEIRDPKAKTSVPTYTMKDMRSGTASVVNVSLPSEKLRAFKKQQEEQESATYIKKEAARKEEEKKEENETVRAEEIEKLTEERAFLEEENFTAGGAMAALKAMRERGYLMENEVEVVGRSKDKTYREELGKLPDNDKEDRIKLEYRDANGRLMKPKEAHRYQSRIFHGIAPSKNKKEKERKKFEAAKKLLQTAPQDSASMRALSVLQQQNNQAYVILNTKNPGSK